MLLTQKVFALIVCSVVFLLTVELVRKRKLREEYSVLWLVTSVVMFVLVLNYDWLVAVTRLIGATLPTTTLFLGSILFLMLLVMQFSLKLSELSDKVKDLAQENALLRAELAGRNTESQTASDQATGTD